MKAIKFSMLAVLVIVVGVIIAQQLTSDEQWVKARYLQLACERCYHMEVEASSDALLVGQTIIPQSSNLDVGALVDSVALSENALCLRGKPYLLNMNLSGVDPDGVRFQVLESVTAEQCESL